MSNSPLLYIHVLPLVLGFFLDISIGDPQGMPHPIRLIGKGIEVLEKLLRKTFPKSAKGELSAGAVLTVTIALLGFGIPFLILYALYSVNIWLGLAVESIMCYYILAIKSLKKESLKVHYALTDKDIEKARFQLSMIVGRDTESLDEEGIVKATVETIAENTSDGTVAPMIFMMVGGAPLGFLYKSINTMDSMIGYRNEKYINFGKIAAKIDDLFNFLPSRLGAVFMICAAAILKMDYKGAWRIFRRDRFNHDSPNSAQTEAVCAGALGVKLAGDAYYFGKLHKKKTIGDSINKVDKDDIIRGNKLLYITAIITVIFCVLGRGLMIWLI